MGAPIPNSRLEITSPRLVRTKGLVVICAYGLLLMVPVLGSVLWVSVVKLGWLTWLVPLLTFAAATCLLPVGFGNPYLASLLSSVELPGSADECFLVQVTFSPRLRAGLRGLLDDADDVGWLQISETALEFRGDSVSLTLPLKQVRGVRVQSIGMRGLFLYQRLAVQAVGGAQLRELWFAERSSWLLSSSRRRTRELCARLRARVAALDADNSSD